ncbi:hypothetical protein LX87_03124 [Larkinella arboricola]|uniref:Uncharacterized protein n=1 Tax=Larkinella arboricola TaxID=643671 RepID=A0A327X0T3_LARAB|nr:hypothetical protein LX87_03124 [Larkinella arboricola]
MNRLSSTMLNVSRKCQKKSFGTRLNSIAFRVDINTRPGWIEWYFQPENTIESRFLLRGKRLYYDNPFRTAIEMTIL